MVNASLVGVAALDEDLLDTLADMLEEVEWVGEVDLADSADSALDSALGRSSIHSTASIILPALTPNYLLTSS